MFHGLANGARVEYPAVLKDYGGEVVIGGISYDANEIIQFVGEPP